jgi:hypothetical protein
LGWCSYINDETASKKKRKLTEKTSSVFEHYPGYLSAHYGSRL